MSLFLSSDARSQRIHEILRSGDQAYSAGDLTAARQRYREAYDLARKLRAYPDAVHVLFTLAALDAQSDLSAAISDLNQCEEIARDRLPSADLSRVLHDLGTAFANLDRLDLARAKLEQGVALDRKTGDVAGWVNKLMSLCKLSQTEGRYADCHALCREGVQIGEEHANGTAMIAAYLRYADLLRDVFCAPDLARPLLTKTELLAPRYADGPQRVELEYQQACLQLRLGNWDEALEHLGKVALSARYNRRPDLLESSQFVLAEICFARQDKQSLEGVLKNLHSPPGSPVQVKLDILRTRLALHEARHRDAIELLERIPQQKGWIELERAVLLAVIEARMGVPEQAKAYLQYAERTLETIRGEIPPDFHENVQHKPEVVELEQVKGMVV